MSLVSLDNDGTAAGPATPETSHGADAAQAPGAALAPAAGLIRVATVGSVDDGKSTLVGRLLLDAKAVLADTLKHVTSGSRASVGRGDGSVDLSLLVDGLRAEQEQGITIDVAHRYLTTPRRSIHLVDCPGHVEYTRNTVTGASLADAALLLVDARNGVLEQTRRHTAVLGLLNVRHLILAVNKIDLIDYDEDRFRAIVAEVSEYAAGVGLPGVTAVPVSALDGDNVSSTSSNTPWYSGPSLLELLETLEIPARQGAALRLPIQWVDAQGSERGVRIAGTITAGLLRPGDRVVVLPSGRSAVVTELTGPRGPVVAAGEDAAVSLRLEGLDSAGRGELIAGIDDPPAVVAEAFADVAITNDRELRAGEPLLVRFASALVGGVVEAVLDRLDVATGKRESADVLQVNDIGRVRLRFDEPLPVDPYERDRSTGGLLLLDGDSGDVRAAVLIRGAADGDAA
jgi:sulfate adenylyltransferase large subunit